MRDHSTNRSGVNFEEAIDDLIFMGNKIEIVGAQVRNLLFKMSNYITFMTIMLCRTSFLESFSMNKVL